MKVCRADVSCFLARLKLKAGVQLAADQPADAVFRHLQLLRNIGQA